MRLQLNRDSYVRERGLKGFLYWWMESERNKHSLYINTAINIIILASLYFLYLDLSLPDSSHGKRYISLANELFLLFFVLEYLARFYVSSDFMHDIRKPNGGVFVAIKEKIKWMTKFFSVIDLLSILPFIRYFRILRFFRLLRFLRILSWFKKWERYALALRGMKQSWRVLSLLILSVFFVSSIVGYGLYYNEQRIEESAMFGTYKDAFWYCIGKFNIVDTKPTSLAGKVFGSLLLAINLVFISSFISFMAVNLGRIMEKVRQGNAGFSSMKNHIVVCGFTTSSKLLIHNLLREKANYNNIVLITLRKDPDISGVLYLNGDYSDEEILEKANIKQAKICTIFGEIRENESLDNADMRTVLTVFNVENDSSNVHTIAEINDPKKAELIQSKMGGDEVLFKSSITADVINTCVKYPYISKLINDLLSPTGKHFKNITLAEIGLSTGAKFKEVKSKCLDRDFIVVGVMCENKSCHPEPVLGPPNDFILEDSCKIIIVG